jgi:hypothetical protein
MTDTQLKEHLHAVVRDVEVAPDLLVRARLGGARRLRRRQFTGIAGASLAVAAVAGVLIGVPAVRDHRTDRPPVATTTKTATPTGPWVDPIKTQPGDHYAVLMQHETGGDLAGDAAYLDQVRRVWEAKQRAESSSRHDPLNGNIWAALRGEPRIYWAGNTPAGRIALVVQHYQVPHPDPTVTYALTGIYTLVGIVRDDQNGRPQAGGFVFPYDPSSYPVFDVRDPGRPSLFVVIGLGKRLGWGLTRQQAVPMNFSDGVAVVQVPAASFEKVQFWELPAR